MAKNRTKLSNALQEDKFVQMWLSGMSVEDISKDFGVDRSTVYLWLKRPSIITQVDRYKQDIETCGKNFIKSRYVKYLQNIDALSNQTEDKRTALSANQWLCEKMDGKAIATIDLNTKVTTIEIGIDNDDEKLIDDTTIDNDVINDDELIINE